MDQEMDQIKVHRHPLRSHTRCSDPRVTDSGVAWDGEIPSTLVCIDRSFPAACDILMVMTQKLPTKIRTSPAELADIAREMAKPRLAGSVREAAEIAKAEKTSTRPREENEA
jgi:hypothetical protein